MSSLKDYLPKLYDNVLEINTVMSAEDELFKLLEQLVIIAENNQYVSTADSAGLTDYENLLGINADTTTEDTEFRRQRLINRLSMSPPFTLKFLEQKLDEIIGVGAWKTRMDYDNLTLYVESSAESQIWYHEVLVTINSIKPANVVFVNTPFTADILNVNEAINAFELIKNYRLGISWSLGAMPFVSYTDKGVIKMATVKSIGAGLLAELATFTADDVAKVRVNDTYIISTGIDKIASQNVATVQYQVSTSLGVDTITKLELLDSSNNVLTSSQVYVPLLQDVTMKHTITVKEG